MGGFLDSRKFPKKGSMYTTRQPKKLPKRKILMLLKFVDACSQKEKTGLPGCQRKIIINIQALVVNNVTNKLFTCLAFHLHL